MRFFKLPLIVTGVTLLVAIIIGLVVVTWIHRSPLSNRQKEMRAQKLGGATAVGVLVIVTPFWLVAAAKCGKARRKALEEAQNPPAESSQ